MEGTWTRYFEGHLQEVLAELQTYVEMETPSHEKARIDLLGAVIAERFAALGCTVEKIAQPAQGDQLRISYGTGDEQILVLGHFDTVKDVGTLATEPWRIEDGKAYGPGTYDMKSGIVFSYFALKAMIEHGIEPQKKLVFFWNTDEEIGSPSGSAPIVEEAKKSALALVIEPCYGDGYLKTSRKGGGVFTVRAKGRAAHAGNEHQSGINAVWELAHQILTIQGWTDYEAGTTLSVGKIIGGTTFNVVPEHAEMVVDVRVQTAAESERVTKLFAELKPVLPGAELHVSGEIDKFPMERTSGTERLYLHAQEQAKLEGFALKEIGVGGVSDGNVAALAGIPILDGLGPVGDGAHAPHEHITVAEIPRRIALLLRLFSTL
ncbi:peptidase M20 [Tumebacillus algifaecis]|uniref:Peptidase M20 n=1 Tax=Tumebacillus algifaecis TaxID=1214604 RepID=A0A223D3H5_9BACL|nr:M20 family metallopeptidase [Tumebacillus algifaecis]ASS76198.1 peptidase M20 [Tumebacillus algifaecis]